MKKTIKLTETQLKKLFIQTLSEEKNKKSKKCEITIEVPESICDICRESGMSNEEICDIYKDFVMNCIGADEDNEQEMFMSWAEENGLIDDEGEEDDEEDEEEGDDDDEDEEEDFLDDFEDDEEEDEEDDDF